MKGLIKGDSFLTPSLPMGLPLTSKIVWRLRQSKILQYMLGSERVNNKKETMIL